MLIYLVLAVLASSLMAFGLLMMKSRAASMPQARGSAIVSSVIAWCREPIWIGGVGVQTIGWVFYVVAVSHAPLSMVAVMMQGGIALFVISSVLFFGERAHPAEWAGIVAIVTGMLLLSLSLSAGASQGTTDDHAIVVISIVMLGVAGASFINSRLAQTGIAQAIGSGIAFGLAGLYTKAMTDSLAIDGGDLAIRIIANPWVYTMMAANLAGMVMLQNSFHQARGIITMPLSSALSNLVPIAGGMLAFGERLPSDPTAAAMRVCAFILTIAASTTLATSHGAPTPSANPALKRAEHAG